MKICMFGAGSPHIKEKYIQVGYELGEHIAKNNHSLVFGGGADGLMGAVAQGAKDNNGEIIAIVPKWIHKFASIDDEVDEMIYTEGMPDRKNMFLEKSDAFIILPGGLGTLDEIFEIVERKKFQEHNKPIMVYNCFNFYDSMLTMISDMIDEKTIMEDNKRIFKLVNNVDEIFKYLEEYDYEENQGYKFK